MEQAGTWREEGQVQHHLSGRLAVVVAVAVKLLSLASASSSLI